MFMTQQQQQTLPKIIKEMIIRMNSLEGQTTSKNWKWPYFLVVAPFFLIFLGKQRMSGLISRFCMTLLKIYKS